MVQRVRVQSRIHDWSIQGQGESWGGYGVSVIHITGESWGGYGVRGQGSGPPTSQGSHGGYRVSVCVGGAWWYGVGGAWWYWVVCVC